MTLQIGPNDSPLFRSLASTSRSLLDASRRLATGRRITGAADDAAGLAISQRLGALETAIEQGRRNLNDGISLAQTAEGGLSQQGEILGRLRELSVQAGNGTLSDTDRSLIQQEFDQLTAEFDRIAQSTSFNGRDLLDGSLSGPGAVSLEDGTDGADITVSVDDQSAAASGLTGLDVADPATLDSLDAAIERNTRARAGLGASINRLESSIDNLGSVSESLASARSRIEDADFAKLTAQRTQAQILQQGQLAIAAQGNALASSALALLS